MGSLRRKTVTKQLPPNAELIQRRGEQIARWVDGRGKKRTAKTTTGRDGSTRVSIESGKWFAKYRDGSGRIREVSTGCSDKGAAAAVLTALEKRAEHVRSGILSPSEDAIADHQTVPLADHFNDYLINMRSRGLSDSHISEVTRYLRKLATECRFGRLSDLIRSRFDQWLVDRRNEDAGARSLNCCRAAWLGFLNWCVATSRLTSNPLAGVPQADEKSDRRRQRRSMNDDELNQLLFVGRWRPLGERGRETIRLEPGEQRKRSNWKMVPLTFDSLEAAVNRARELLSHDPERIAKLERTGQERQLIYKTMLTTGLRKKELSSVRLRNLYLDSEPAFVMLDAANEKNREGNSLPLRADLAAELREWLSERLAARRNAARHSATVSFEVGAARLQGNVSDNEREIELSPDELLFKVPSSLLRVLDRDLKAAGIAKRDDRGRTLDIHALRHTFGTHLSLAGVPLRTAQAAMRHSSPVLTANVYTDPRLLDIHGAVESLPALTSTGATHDGSGKQRATNTADDRPPKLAPLLAPKSYNRGQTVSFPVTSGKLESFDSEQNPESKTDEKPTKKARILIQKDSGLESGRHDLNMRLPAPKAGALPS